MLSVLTQFLSNRSQYVVVDGCHSKLPQGSVLGLLLLPLVHCGAFLCGRKQALRLC